MVIFLMMKIELFVTYMPILEAGNLFILIILGFYDDFETKKKKLFPLKMGKKKNLNKCEKGKKIFI